MLQKAWHQTAVPEVPESTPGSDKHVYVCFFVLLVFCFNLNGRKIIICHQIWQQHVAMTNDQKLWTIEQVLKR